MLYLKYRGQKTNVNLMIPGTNTRLVLNAGMGPICLEDSLAAKLLANNPKMFDLVQAPIAVTPMAEAMPTTITAEITGRDDMASGEEPKGVMLTDPRAETPKEPDEEPLELDDGYEIPMATVEQKSAIHNMVEKLGLDKKAVLMEQAGSPLVRELTEEKALEVIAYLEQQAGV